MHEQKFPTGTPVYVTETGAAIWIVLAHDAEQDVYWLRRAPSAKYITALAGHIKKIP